MKDFYHLYTILHGKGDDSAAAIVERINSRHGINTADYAAKIGLSLQSYKLGSLDK